MLIFHDPVGSSTGFVKLWKYHSTDHSLVEIARFAVVRYPTPLVQAVLMTLRRRDRSTIWLSPSPGRFSCAPSARSTAWVGGAGVCHMNTHCVSRRAHRWTLFACAGTPPLATAPSSSPSPCRPQPGQSIQLDPVPSCTSTVPVGGSVLLAVVVVVLRTTASRTHGRHVGSLCAPRHGQVG
jgi:hypothetical protein